MNLNNRALAEVAVALPVSGTFNYLIPEGQADRMPPGMRVLVPFGRRRVTGYVLDHPREAFANGRVLKEIIEPLDEVPLIGPSLIPFFRFAADYYHYPIGMVAAEALPAGLKVMSHKTVRLTEAGRQALENPLSLLSSEEALFLDRLDKTKGLTMAALAKEKGPGLKLASRLESQGLVEIVVKLSRDRVRTLTRRWISIVPNDAEYSGRLGPKEKALLDRLSQTGPLPLDDLREEFPNPSALARRLEQKGLVAAEDRVVYRDALGRALLFNEQAPTLSDEQAVAVAALSQALDKKAFAPFVLFGITGSGKTEVYLAAARQALDQGRTALFLVPEISLTPAMEGLLKARFKEDAAVLHSGLSDGERLDQWLKIRQQGIRIVLGARSAIFAPLENLGLIVVDEEHDGAYKQEDKLRYQARDLALLRGSQAGAVVVLGSATPSLESFQAAATGRYSLLSLSERVGEGRLPQVDVVDLRKETGRRRAVTPVLHQALKETLAQGQQALLFINRRGLAGLPICLSCGFVLKCRNCSVSLTLHQSAEQGESDYLSCHYCGYDQPPAGRCPECGSKLFKYLGVGTEKLEKEVQAAFPEARVGRLDADTARPKGELTRILEALRDREIDVLVGTQMITKGHDFPNITLVGVIEADLGLHLPDFRAGERTFQLLSQVSGRAGRGSDPGRVIVQTYSPDHYSLLLAKEHDYLSFFEEEIHHRRDSGYPPLARLIMVRLQGNSEKRTAQAAEDAVRLGQSLGGPRPPAELFGPAPAPLAKVKGKYRFQILVRGFQVKPLHNFLNHWLDRVRPMLKGQGVALAVDVDPYQMM